jgi:hypothetical protein
MDMSLLGETIYAPAINQKNYGFWMPAGGNDGVAGCEVFYNSGGGAFTVYLETKSSDQDDSSAAPIGNVSVSAASAAATTYKFDVNNARDLVRYRIDSTRNGYIHLQFAQPMWQPN